MQNLIAAPGSPWNTAWAERVLPNVVQLVEVAPERTVFTRFIPPATPEQMPGTWQRYYRVWRDLTQAHIDPRLLGLVDPLPRFVPPALVMDKPVYSAFSGHYLQRILQERQVDTLVVSGTETDVCVLATVLGAVDRGYRVILAADAICSSSDHAHDALLSFYRSRLSNQVELAGTQTILAAWPR